MRESRAPEQAPRDWNEAFAALPPETPATDALSGVFARIPAPARPGRGWWIAAAAVLALVAIVPLAMDVARRSGEGRSPAPLAASPRPATSAPLQQADSMVASAMPAAVVPDRKALDTRPQRPREATRPRGRDEQERIAKAATPHHDPRRSRKPAPAREPADDAMEPLYAESARLEALLALARDDRVSSATAIALGSDFEARVAGIDAALVQPSLTAQRRLELWKERVSALRTYASFESTQRALAASGERYDAMLVSID